MSGKNRDDASFEAEVAARIAEAEAERDRAIAEAEAAREKALAQAAAESRLARIKSHRTVAEPPPSIKC